MKVASSLKSLKKRDLNSKLVKRRGKVYIINRKIPNLKHDKDNPIADNNDHKNTWEGFTKFVLWDNSSHSYSSDFGYNITIKNLYDYWFYKRRLIFRKIGFNT